MSTNLTPAAIGRTIGGSMFAMLFAFLFLSSTALAGPQDTQTECEAAQGTWDAAATGDKCTLPMTVTTLDMSQLAGCGCKPEDEKKIKRFVAEYRVCTEGDGTWNVNTCECDAPAGKAVCTLDGEIGMYSEAACLIAEDRIARKRAEREQVAKDKAQDEALSGLETRVAANETATGANTTAIQGLTGRMDTADADRAAIRAAIDGITPRVATLEGEVTRINTEVGQNSRVLLGLVKDPKPYVRIGLEAGLLATEEMTTDVARANGDGTVERQVQGPVAAGLIPVVGVGVQSQDYRVGAFGGIGVDWTSGDDEDGDSTSFSGAHYQVGAEGAVRVADSAVSLGGYGQYDFRRSGSSPISSRVNTNSGGVGGLVVVDVPVTEDVRFAWQTKIGVAGVKMGTEVSGQPFATSGVGFTASTGIGLVFGP